MSSVYRIGEFGVKIGRSTSTVRRWESEGRISARSPSGQRFFTDVDVAAVLSAGFDRDDRKTVVYCRVSSANQRAGLGPLSGPRWNSSAWPADWTSTSGLPRSVGG